MFGFGSDRISMCDAGLNTNRGAGLGSTCSGDCSENCVINIIHIVKPVWYVTKMMHNVMTVIHDKCCIM